MSRPFGYLRKSSVRDLATDLSPETQEREVRALAARHGDVITGDALLSDWDVSGRAEFTRKREGYLRLVEAVESGECSAVYSYSLSRLGRSVAELSRFFDLSAGRKVPIRLVVDSVDTSTASGRLLANVLGSVSQFEAEVASERQHARNDTKRARALAEGRDPDEAVRTSRRYGERKVGSDGRVRGDGEDAQVVLDVFRREGNYSQAARRLNEMGVKPKRAKHWWASSVAAIVERLDPEVAVQRASSPARGADGGRPVFALARLLRCGTCGHMLTGSHLPDGRGGRRVRYACRFAESQKHPRVAISEHLILAAVEAEAALYRDPDESAGPDTRAARRDELASRRQRVVEARLDGLLDRAEARRQVADIDAELARIETPPRRDLRLPASWSPSEVNTVLRQLFERIDLDPRTFQPVSFVWRDPSLRGDA